jgi:hypothetical protein
MVKVRRKAGFREGDGGILGTFMISKVKGKTEISLYLPVPTGGFFFLSFLPLCSF